MRNSVWCCGHKPYLAWIMNSNKCSDLYIERLSFYGLKNDILPFVDHRIVGVTLEKTNVAIVSKDEQFLQDLLKVSDSKGMTQWSDRDS